MTSDPHTALPTTALLMAPAARPARPSLSRVPASAGGCLEASGVSEPALCLLAAGTAQVLPEAGGERLRGRKQPSAVLFNSQREPKHPRLQASDCPKSG